MSLIRCATNKTDTLDVSRIRNNQIVPYDHDYSSNVPPPLEVALAHLDEVAHLLVALGADVNELVRQGLEGFRITYLDFARLSVQKAMDFKDRAVSSVPTAVSNLFATNNPAASSLEPPVWKRELQKIIAVCNDVQAKQNTAELTQKMFVDETTTYFNDMSSLFTSVGGKTGGELKDLDDEQESARLKSLQFFIHDVPGQYYKPSTHVLGYGEPQFFRHTKGSPQAGMHSALVKLYDELFTACYTGNNHRIQQLCMPHSSQKTEDTPLQISVHWGNQWHGTSNNAYLELGLRTFSSQDSLLSMSPFFPASGRR